MTKITKTRRAAVIAIIADSRMYDAGTVRIARSGEVFARKDSDKTLSDYDPGSYLVGYIDDMVTADGQRREGY